MASTDILKLIFHHDQQLSSLVERPDLEAMEDPLSLFTKPDPTYSSFLFSGSDLKREQFGLDTLDRSDEVLGVIGKAMARKYKSEDDFSDELVALIHSIEPGTSLRVDEDGKVPFSGVPDGGTVRALLEDGATLIIKKEAEHGFDLQLLVQENIYTLFFYPLQDMLPDSFRFFSINGKRLRNEKQFFFETWTLANPPHGFEEVFPESIL